MIVEGSISVKAALCSNKREIAEVIFNRHKKSKDFSYIKKLCREKGIRVSELEEAEFLKQVSGKSHGGICARVSPRINDVFDDGDIFYLDGIEDPFNLGYMMRTLYAFGINNILLSKRDYTLMEPQLLKSSAGAYDMANVIVAENEVEEIGAYQKKGYYLYSLYRGDDSKDIFDTRFKKKALFMIGGEKRGISKELLAMSDESLHISYGNSFRNALNASGAMDTVATLLFAQRRNEK